MTNPLAGLTTDNSIKEEGDSLGGYSALESDVYKMKIEKAFTTLSAGKAVALNIYFAGEKNAQLRVKLWVTSGAAKGGKNYYERTDKTTGKVTKHYLPGFNQANALCLLTIGKEISALASQTEKKVIKLYDGTVGKEVPTEVDMIMPLLGQEILAGVLKQKVNKRAKDAASGEYVPTNEIMEENEIDKFFCARPDYSMFTLAEIKDKLPAPIFFDSWVKKWKGQVKDKTVKNVPVAGAPGTTQSAGTQAPQTSIFS